MARNGDTKAQIATIFTLAVAITIFGYLGFFLLSAALERWVFKVCGMSWKRVFDKRATSGAVVESTQRGVKFKARKDAQHWSIQLVDFITKLG